jgi:tetratricopeptide (TPR) repeat protein
VNREAERALSLNAQNLDAMAAAVLRARAVRTFRRAALVRLRRAPGTGDGQRYIGWGLRHFGWMREALTATEQAYQLDALDPMSANLLALARMAAGHVADAIPVFEELVERMPTMSFPVASLLRAHAFQQDWAAVDRLLALAEQRQLCEFHDGLPFIRAKRDPSPAHIGACGAAPPRSEVRENGRQLLRRRPAARDPKEPVAILWSTDGSTLEAAVRETTHENRVRQQRSFARINRRLESPRLSGWHCVPEQAGA